MIHPSLLSSTAYGPVTESQKQDWKIAIRNQPSKVNAYRCTPVESYNILKINELEFLFKTSKKQNPFTYFTAFVYLGISWRFSDWGIVSSGVLIYLIQQHFFVEKTPWDLKVSAIGVSIALPSEHKITIDIPFQQIICMDFEAYFDADNKHSTELVIYYATHQGGYFTQRVAIVENEADKMGIIHYFLNQYQNS